MAAAAAQASAAAGAPPLERCAYVALLYGGDAEYALGALLLATSLRRCGARAPLVLLYTADVPEAKLELLRGFYSEVRLIADPVHLPDDSPLCACSRDFGHRQFLKLHLLELEFEKVLYLDCDVLVRRNLDGLFALQAPAAMDRILPTAPHGVRLPNRVHHRGRRVRGIQGGVMLLAPEPARFAEMRREVESWRRGDPGFCYPSSVGNEQDYLTWRYCLGRAEEAGHAPVWTQLGCEYNYEAHAPSFYFGLGRERWLWLDYERDVAVLHFSAFRKRAKRVLHVGSEGTAAVPEDPRVAFAHRAWDFEVEQLRAETAARGVDLAAWLGEGRAAHAAAFAVLDRGADAGMEIRQLPAAGAGEDATAEAGGRVLVFEAFTANCGPGLAQLPPGFAPGPPWGAAFWAEQCEGLEAEENWEEEYGRGHEVPEGESADDSLAGLDEEELHECAAEAGAVAFGCAGDAGANGGSTGGAGGAAAETADGCLQAAPPAGPGCDCESRLGPLAAAPAASGAPAQGELEVLGAWLRQPGGGGGGRGQYADRWAFGLVAEPPHLPECPSWRLAVAFRALVLERPGRRRGGAGPAEAAEPRAA